MSEFMDSFNDRISKLTVRDFTVFLLCAIILYLIGSKDQYELAPKWRLDMDPIVYYNHRFPTEEELLPSPMITDLDGDGSNEVIVVTNNYYLYVMEPDNQQKSPNILPHPRMKYQIPLPLNTSDDGRLSHPVSMTTGYLTVFKSKDHIRKQVIVIVTDDWYVMCFTHELKLLWSTQLMDVGPARDDYYVKSQQVLVMAIRLHKKDEGLIIVGGSYGHKVHRNSEETFGEQQWTPSNDDNTVDTDSLTHFTTFALSGSDGTVRWHHLPGDFGEKHTMEKDFESAHHWKLAIKRGHLHKGELPWTHYKNDFLKYLPHSWTRLSDTNFLLGNIKKSTTTEQNEESTTMTNIIGLDTKHIMGYAYGGLSPHSPQEHVTNPNSLIIHNDQGIEVLHLLSGQPITKLGLPAGQTSYADINGDKEIEEIFKRFFLGTDQYKTECEVIVKRFQQSENVFVKPFCDPSGFSLKAIFIGPESFTEDMAMTLPPLIVRGIAKKTGIVGLMHHLSGESFRKRSHEMDVIVVTSSGKVASYGAKGELHWLVEISSKWSDMTRKALDEGLVDPMVRDTYRNGFKPSIKGMSLRIYGEKDAAVIVGWDSMSLINLRHGTLLGEKKIPCQSLSNIVTGDFDDNGWTDIIVTCPFGYLGFSIEPHTNWMSFILLRLAVVLVILLLSWCCSPEKDEDYSY